MYTSPISSLYYSYIRSPTKSIHTRAKVHNIDIVQLLFPTPNGATISKSKIFSLENFLRRRGSVVPWYLVPIVRSLWNTIYVIVS